jgi:membrane-associated PAP2 superfamily phosphatase
MSSDFFDRLDAELAALTRQGAHLTAGDGVFRRAGRLARRGLSFALVAVTLAAALVSEFPASASGHAQAARDMTAQRL